MPQKIGLIYNSNRKENLDLAKRLEKYLGEKKITTSLCKVGDKNPEWNKLDKSIDFAVVLGGDGTLLHTSRILAPEGIPIFGINTGHLGFLTEGKSANVIELVSEALNNNFTVDEREMLASCIIESNKRKEPFYALNDVVINRGTSRKMISMTLNIDGKPAADYIADGLIICTPTGSTAYAMSAGGAVMEPGSGVLQIVPICAHTLTSRPHIVSDKREITVTFNKPHEGTTMHLDGQEVFQIDSGSKVKVKLSKYKAKLIRLKAKENDFYWRIRHKFHWGLTAQ